MTGSLSPKAAIHERARCRALLPRPERMCILVGEALMRSKDIAGKVKELLGHQD